MSGYVSRQFPRGVVSHGGRKKTSRQRGVPAKNLIRIEFRPRVCSRPGKAEGIGVGFASAKPTFSRWNRSAFVIFAGKGQGLGRPELREKGYEAGGDHGIWIALGGKSLWSPAMNFGGALLLAP